VVPTFDTKPDAGALPEPSQSGTAVRGAWYADPYGSAAERWWDGCKWTRQVRGTPAAPAASNAALQELTPHVAADAMPRRRVMAPGWYPWNATMMRYWDGTAWKQTRERTSTESIPDEPRSPKWMVRAGYVAAVLIPLLGVILGMLVAVRPEKGARGQGIRIITLSIVVFAVAILLSHRH
jgi:hypothetical protein